MQLALARVKHIWVSMPFSHILTRGILGHFWHVPGPVRFPSHLVSILFSLSYHMFQLESCPGAVESARFSREPAAYIVSSDSQRLNNGKQSEFPVADSEQFFSWGKREQEQARHTLAAAMGGAYHCRFCQLTSTGLLLLYGSFRHYHVPG